MSRMRIALLACAAALVAGCGGGDDGPRVDAAAAWHDVLHADASFSLAGIGNDGRAYAMTLQLAPLAPAAYPPSGELLSRSLHAVTLARDGVGLGTTTTELFFDAAADQVVGARGDDGRCATVVAHQQALPRSAPLGSLEPLYDADSLDGCSAGAARTGEVFADWSVEAEGGIVFFCVTSTQRDFAGNTVGSQADCLEAAADGRLGPRARVGIFAPASASAAEFSLVLRNY